jgi:class 3 adenylate cyclase/tetratricopeptide (TPR) repeat protein
MRCSSCGAENPQGLKFCNECAAPFKRRCGTCGFENTATAKFCGECAAPLNSATAPVSAEPQLREGPTGERRHLTVLFCDLAGSTGIAAQLDPEEWRETVGGYHHAAAEAITRFGGHVAKYLGDGVMAFFGYPQAHDNDAERAARAGLAIIEAIAKLNQQPGRTRLSARVGIHSGAVVVGAGAGSESDVFGDAPNIAARVQEAATPGTVVVTDDTHRLISGLFVVEERGAPALKGVDRPIELYQVIQPSGVRGRLEAVAAARGLTPFVGREDELRLLMNRWESAREGEGQVALIVGEAGIGKSRLVQRFHEQIAGTPHTWIETAAGVFFQNTPFYPVGDLLKQALGSRGDEPAERQLEQLESVLEFAGLQPAEAIPLLAPLLNLPPSTKYPPSALSPEQQRRRLLATLVELALGIARVQPTVITTEDLHWVDASTLELIELLVEQGAQARLLLVYTARPEFRAPWPMRPHHTQITLNRLSSRNVRTMVAQVAARNALPEETIAAMVERTGGVPLFVEELTRAVLESGDAKLTGREIPATLHDSLMARLDRLGPAKEVIQVGAVIGSEFSYQLLHAVHPIAEADLQRALRALAESELLHVRGIAPEATYLFKHALIRDAAYEALLKSRRKELHRQVARTIDEQFTALGAAHPEVLARHWTEAGEIEPAIAQWSKAGEIARARNAFREAQESCQRAVALLTTLPESPERDLRELELGQSIVWMLSVTQGHAAPETIEATARLAALAEKSGNLKQLFNLMDSKAAGAFFAGDPAAGMLADQLLDLALREASPGSLERAHAQQIFTHYTRGDLAGVEQHFAAWLTFCDDRGSRQTSAGAPGARGAPFGFASWNAWILGRADLARQREVQMMAAANANDPQDMAWLWYFAATLRLFLRELEQAETLAGRALELSEQNQFPQIAAFSRCTVGFAQALLGRATEGIGRIQQGIADLQAVGGRGRGASYLTALAAAQLFTGAVVEALATVEQALDDPMARPGALTLRGEMRLIQGQSEPAEADFCEAIALARGMSAKAWELTATMSLARLLDKKGHRDQARSMLAEIYGQFTEGFDTADLKDAKALLDGMEAQP